MLLIILSLTNIYTFLTQPLFYNENLDNLIAQNYTFFDQPSGNIPIVTKEKKNNLHLYL